MSEPGVFEERMNAGASLTVCASELGTGPRDETWCWRWGSGGSHPGVRLSFDSSVCLAWCGPVSYGAQRVVCTEGVGERREGGGGTEGRSGGWMGRLYWPCWAGSLGGASGSEAPRPSAHERAGWSFSLRRLDVRARARSRSEQRGSWLGGPPLGGLSWTPSYTPPILKNSLGLFNQWTSRDRKKNEGTLHVWVPKVLPILMNSFWAVETKTPKGDYQTQLKLTAHAHQDLNGLLFDPYFGMEETASLSYTHIQRMKTWPFLLQSLIPKSSEYTGWLEEPSVCTSESLPLCSPWTMLGCYALSSLRGSAMCTPIEIKLSKKWQYYIYPEKNNQLFWSVCQNIS